MTKWRRSVATTGLAFALVIVQSAVLEVQARDLGAMTAQADRRDGRHDKVRPGTHDRDDGRNGRRGSVVRDRRGREHARPPVYAPLHRGRDYRVVPGRTRHYRNIIVIRPHGRWYYGYGHWHHDNDAYKWLAFTAITLALLDFLNESQQRAHEEAQVRATTAPVGETIHWNEGGASGSVTALRDGYTSTGRYCREFQQKIVVGGRTEDAYGTACQQPDGSWEIVSTGD